MIASAKRPKSKCKASAQHAAFLAMLPAIRRSAQVAFRKLPPELRHDLIEEVVANSYVAFARLVERGHADRALPTPLARFAITQIRVGRRVGSRLRIGDALSTYAQYRKQFFVERLDHFSEEKGCWGEILVEDKRATPADVAACRIDFTEWLRRLTARLRKIALALAAGETTSAAAKMFGVTPARISQIRDLLRKSWEAFQGGPEVGDNRSRWPHEGRYGAARHGFDRGGRHSSNSITANPDPAPNRRRSHFGSHEAWARSSGGAELSLPKEAPVGVAPTVADLQSDHNPRNSRRKLRIHVRPQYHRTTTVIWPELWPRGRRCPMPSAGPCSR